MSGSFLNSSARQFSFELYLSSLSFLFLVFLLLFPRSLCFLFSSSSLFFPDLHLSPHLSISLHFLGLSPTTTQAGLSPGLTLLAINGEDVSKSTPLRVLKSLMVMFMSPAQRRSTLSLLVLPCTDLLAHAWAPNAPRHVLLMRSDTTTGGTEPAAAASTVAPLAHAVAFGIEAVAGASRETLAFVSRVAEDAVAAHGAVHVADRIAAINGVKITGISYSTLSLV